MVLCEKVNNSCQNFPAYLCSESSEMRKHIIYTACTLFLTGFAQMAMAQCSICTKTASQLGEGPASALNSAIIYLAAAPFAVMGYIGYKWWKNEKQQ
jgi:hypothetical protein